MSYHSFEPQGSSSWARPEHPAPTREQVSPTDRSYNRPANFRATVPENENVKKRGRITMACLHCRQRKIKCNGDQPACSTCTRLKRECTYEAVPEEENLATRERKRIGKEAKESRLAALARLGIMLPRSGGMPAAEPIYQSTASRNRPRPVRTASGRELAAPYQYPRWPSEQAVPPFGSQYSAVGHPVRRRGITIGGYEVEEPAGGSFGQRGTSFGSEWNERAAYSSHKTNPELRISRPTASPGKWSGYGLSSLSQPTTPEETYMTHASMLQSDLATPATPSDLVFPSPWIPTTGLPSQTGLTEVPFEYSGQEPYNVPEAPVRGMAQTPAGATTILPEPPAPSVSPRTASRIMPLTALPRDPREDSNSWSRPPSGSGAEGRRRSSYDTHPSHLRRASKNDAAIAAFFHRVVTEEHRFPPVPARFATTSRPDREVQETQELVEPRSTDTAVHVAWPPPMPDFHQANAPTQHRQNNLQPSANFSDPWLSANHRSASGSTLVSITGTDLEHAGGESGASSGSSASRGGRHRHVTGDGVHSRMASSGRNSTSSVTSVPTEGATQAHNIAMRGQGHPQDPAYLSPSNWASRQNSLGGSSGGSNNSGYSSGVHSWHSAQGQQGLQEASPVPTAGYAMNLALSQQQRRVSGETGWASVRPNEVFISPDTVLSQGMLDMSYGQPSSGGDGRLAIDVSQQLAERTAAPNLDAEWLGPSATSGAPSPEAYWTQQGSGNAQHQMGIQQRQPSLGPSLGHRQSFAGPSGDLPFWLRPDREPSSEVVPNPDHETSQNQARQL